MEQQYTILFHIHVKHEYFDNGSCQGLSFEPSIASQYWLKKNEIQIRYYNDGFSLIGSQNNAFVQEEDLVFFAFSEDPKFSFYTLKPPQGDGAIPVYTSKPDNKGELPLSWSKPTELFVDTQTPVVLPCFAIKIALPPSGQASSTKENTIILNSRSIHWKYYFFGEFTQLPIKIIDISSSNERFSFSPSSMPNLPGGSAYVSNQPIPMRAIANQRFQLQEEGSSRVLLKRLPQADLGMISKEFKSDDQFILVAEAYVNP